MIPSPPQRVVFVTGPSGAGRATAIRALEDLGFEAIDNIPLALVERLLHEDQQRPLALGLDVRTRDFSLNDVAQLMARLQARADVWAQLLYLDCQEDILLRRFSETRRRHPLAPEESAAEGVRRELDLIAPLRDRADVLINTSDLTPHGLRQDIASWFSADGGSHLAITVQSFSYKRGLPNGVDIAMDCRFLRNPYWQPQLRDKTGQDPEVAQHIAEDSRFDEFFQGLRRLVDLLLPAYVAEGKSHFVLGFGCTGGQHRSVFVTERLAEALAQEGWQVSIRHRELDRRKPDHRRT